MTPWWKQKLHRGSRAVGWCAGILVIALAVLAALAQLLLPLLARNPEWVASQLSSRLQQPVSFQSMEGRWTASGPLFVMRGVSVGPGAGESRVELQIPQAELRLDFGGWLLPSRHMVNLHVKGLQLDLSRDADGGWHVNGLGMAGGGTTQPLPLRNLSMDFWLDDLRVAVNDVALDRHYVVQVDQLRLSRHGSDLRFGALLRRDGVAATVRASGRFSDDGRFGKVWLGVGQAELKPLLAEVDLGGYAVQEGRGTAAAWLDWRDGKVERSVLRVDFDAMKIASPAGAVAQIESLHGLAGVERDDTGYSFRWAGDDGSTLAANLHQPGTPAARLGVAANRLQLAPLLPWLALQPDLSVPLARWVGEGKPRGQIERLALQWRQDGGLQVLDMAFRELAIAPVGTLPGVTRLRGEVRGDAEAISLFLPAQSSTISSDRFSKPFALSSLAGALAFWQDDSASHIGIDALELAGEGYAMQFRGEVSLPSASDTGPFVDIYALIDHADVQAAKRFWPIHAMPPATMDWLNRGLVEGRIEQAQALVRGNFDDWPFEHNEGRFEAHVPLNQLKLDYGVGWPQADGIDLVANFINNGLRAEVSRGQALGVKVEGAVALIPDFDHAVLDLSVRGNGSGGSLMDFVRKSPIGAKEADTLGKLKVGGNGVFDFQLLMPLAGKGESQLTGKARLSKMDVSAPEWDLQLNQLTGALHFDLDGMRSEPMDVSYLGQPAKLQMAVAGANPDPRTVFSTRLRGRYRFDELLKGRESLQWIGEAADGRSDFTINFAVARAGQSQPLSQVLSIESSLSGVALALPAPLDKPAASSLPLRVTLGFPIDGSDLQVSLGNVLRGKFRLADSRRPLAATLAFGSQMPQTVPVEGIRVQGQAKQLDVTGWVAQVAGGHGADGPGVESLNVNAAESLWFGQPLGGMRLSATSTPEQLDIDVEGAAMAGTFNVPITELSKRGITARLQRLHWPQASPNADADGKVVEVEQDDPDPGNTGVNPAALPPFHLWVADLRLGEAKLGEARLETWPTANGMHIEQLRALSRQVQITASGEWNGSATDSRTRMRMAFAAEDLGEMLGAFGFNGLVEGGKTNDELIASWPGSPSAMSLANMEGTIKVQVNHGRIPEAASPGAGRFLGLVSLAELPRRLTLDFGDVFGKGLAFDSITGDFTLGGGNAVTDNLEIVGPSATISITGRAGLRAKDFDQQVTVVPRLGNSLPIVGAVVGGPIGAAAGLAVQGLLGKGINQVATARYRITGPWDKPVMTLIEKRQVPVTAPDDGRLEPAQPEPAVELPAAPSSSGLPTPAPASSVPAAARSSGAPSLKRG